MIPDRAGSTSDKSTMLIGGPMVRELNEAALVERSSDEEGILAPFTRLNIG